MVEKHGLCRVCMRIKSTPFTHNASVVFLKFYGNKKSPRGSVETYWTHHYVLSLSQRKLCCLGPILRIGDERIPKSMLYSDLVDGRLKRGRPLLHFKDVCKRDLKCLNVGSDKWELANDHDKWQSSVYRSLKERENQFFMRSK